MSLKSHAKGLSIWLTEAILSGDFCLVTVEGLGCWNGVIGQAFHCRAVECGGLWANCFFNYIPIVNTWIVFLQFVHLWLFIPQQVYCCALFNLGLLGPWFLRRLYSNPIFYFSLHWCCALSFPFGFHFYFVGCIFFGRILLSLVSGFCVNLFLSLAFPSWVISGATEATVL